MNMILATVRHSEALWALDHSRAYSAHWTLEGWQAELKQPASQVWCAVQEEKIVGFVAVRGAAGQYEILNVAVATAYSHRGIASALVRHAWDTLQKQGAGQISLEVSRANIPAQGLYRKLGFEEVGVRKQFYPDGSDALIMEKK